MFGPTGCAALSCLNARLPDVRDGLKPVHRRVLFAMHESNTVWNRPYVKCARVVGDVLGKYHPHGDSATYEALVRMVKDEAHWIVLAVLVLCALYFLVMRLTTKRAAAAA